MLPREVSLELTAGLRTHLDKDAGVCWGEIPTRTCKKWPSVVPNFKASVNC